MSVLAIDWRELTTAELDYAQPVDFEQVFIVQEDAQSIEALPPSPFPPLEPVALFEPVAPLGRLASPPPSSGVPWVALAAFVVTLGGIAIAYGVR